MVVAIVYLSLGTNLGDRMGQLQHAMSEVGSLGRIVACSSVYKTRPWGEADQPRFLNLCCALETDLDPEALLRACKATEAEFPPRPIARQWSARYLDVDLLTYDDLVLETPALTLPHPRLHERAFVLVPLAEIAPDLVIPGLSQTVRNLLDGMSVGPGEVTRVGPPVDAHAAV